MNKKINHICGECGSTGTVHIGEKEVSCPDCGGIGYHVVEMSFDHDEADRLRLKARRASLDKFILLLSAISGASIAYFYAWHLATPVVVVSFFATAVATYLLLQIRPLNRALQIIYDLLRVCIGFALLLGFLAGVGYLIHIARLHFHI